MNEERILLGLDIDGVLNPVRLLLDNEPPITKTSIYYLNKILETVINCDILITSSWGNSDNRTVKRMCDQGFIYPKRVVGSTCFSDSKYSRSIETIEWLDKYTELYKRVDIEYGKIIFLDDELELFAYHEDKYGACRRNVVHIRADIGLDEGKAYETVCKLLGFNFRFW